MTAFRLIRRSLLCFLVGVTAFGVSGWLLRPQPRWEVELDDDSMGLMEPFLGDNAGSGVIWLIGYRLDGPDFLIDGEARRQASAECRDPLSGRLLSRIEECTGDHFRFRSADEFVCWLPVKNTRTRFRVFHRDAPASTLNFSLAGIWTATSDGKRAWSVGNSAEGWCVSLTELHPLSISSRRAIRAKWNPGDFEYAVSSDGRHLAILSDDEGRSGTPRTIDLYDLETGDCRRRIAAPMDVVGQGGAGASYLRFEASSSHLAFRWDAADGDVSLWRFDPFTGVSLNTLDPPVGPPGILLERNPRMYGDAWFAFEKGSRRAWVNLEPDPERPEWAIIPFDMDWGIPSGYRHFIPRSIMPGVPGRNAAVVATREQPWIHSIPQRIRTSLPKSWIDEEVTSPARWFDRRTRQWLEIGRPRERWTAQVRRDALITLSRDSQTKPVLQSWPLPPRDPKYPAAAIAVISAAAIWWLCAWRFARKHRASAA